MNVHEERAWKILLELGAKEISLGGKKALSLGPIRITSKNKLGLFVQAVRDVVGRSNANRWHVDRRGCPIYVVTDFYTLDRATADAVRAEERRAFLARRESQKKESGLL